MLCQYNISILEIVDLMKYIFNNNVVMFMFQLENRYSLYDYRISLNNVVHLMVMKKYVENNKSKANKKFKKDKPSPRSSLLNSSSHEVVILQQL